MPTTQYMLKPEAKGEVRLLPAQTAREIIKEISGSKVIETMARLYERWQDEHEYEDFNGYVDYMKTQHPAIFAGTKRPFGFKFRAGDGVLHVKVKASGRYKLRIEYTILGRA